MQQTQKQRRNEQRIITHAYTATVLIAVAVKRCLITPYNRTNGQIMNSQTRTKQTKARHNKKTAESAGNISAMKVASAVHVTREYYSPKNWVQCLKIT